MAQGDYPYFFLNLAKLGFAQTALNVLGLLGAFALVSSILIVLGRTLHKLGLSR